MWTSGEDFSEHCGTAASTEVILSALSHSDIAGKVTYWISPRTTNVASPFRIQNKSCNPVSVLKTKKKNVTKFQTQCVCEACRFLTFISF
jgi:hypothetical protein